MTVFCGIWAYRPASAQTPPADTLQAKSTAKPARKSPNGAMLRSMALPGWGQWYNHKTFKALLVTGGELGLVADMMVQNQWAQKARDPYERAFYVNNRNLAAWWLAGVILYSMADAYVDAHLFDFDESTELSLRPPVSPSGSPGLCLALTVQF